MKIVKVINNNVVSSVDDDGKEVVVTGKGLGFQKKPGDEIDPQKIEKIYRLDDEQKNQFVQLMEVIPYEQLTLATKIIEDTKQELKCKLNQSIYIALTDHLNFALERNKQGVAFDNALLWEIQKYYPKEYECALKAVETVKQETGETLSEDEAGFIALHFINAEVDGDITTSRKMPEIVKEILNIIRYTLMVDFDEESLNYQRLISHLKYFVQRAMKKEYYEDDEAEDFYRGIVKKYPEEYECARKIKSYMEQKTNYNVSNEELLYLTVHINRVKRHQAK